MKTVPTLLLASLSLAGCVEKDVYVDDNEPTMPIAETGFATCCIASETGR